MGTITMTTRGELLCVVGIQVSAPQHVFVDEIRTLAVEIRNETRDHVTIVFQDPLDVLLGARHLERALGDRVYVMSMFASEAAVEMLGDPSELSRETWSWLTADVAGEPTARGMLIVRFEDGFRYGPTFPEIADAAARPGLVIAVLGDPLTRQRVISLTQPAWIGNSIDAPVSISNLLGRHVEIGVDSHDGWFARSVNPFQIGGQNVTKARRPLYPGLVLQFRATAVIVLAAS